MKVLRRLLLPPLGLATLVVLSCQELNAAPGTGTLFGTDASNGDLLAINPTTGAAHVVGPMGVGVVPSLAVDPVSGTMYAGRGAGLPNIYTVNPATGAATLLGDTGLGFAAVGDMDFNAAGTLYAAVNIVGDGGSGSDHLAIINKATGAATVIGPFGTCTGVPCTIEGMEGIAFDAAGTLWGSHSARGAGTPGLYRINLGTGAATFIAPLVDASGTPPSGGVVSLHFACDGRLYGGTARATIPPATDGGNLVIINPATGVFSTVGKAVADASLGALAFQSPCAVARIPTVSGGAALLLALLFAGCLTWMVRRIAQ